MQVDKKIDVITLASTHLPFVKRYLNSLLPTVKFVDPAKIVAKDVRKFLVFNRMLKKTGNGRLQVLVSEGKKQFETCDPCNGSKRACRRSIFHFLEKM